LKEKQGENAQNCYGKNRLQRFLWFCGLVEILEFSEIGIAEFCRPVYKEVKMRYR
jgi:hypothetical protein